MADESFRVFEIDADTWLPKSELECVESVTIERSTADDAPLIESGELEVTGQITEGYYRIVAMMPSGEAEDIATLLFTPDGSMFSHQVWGGSAVGKSVLAPAAGRKFNAGAYAPKGCDGTIYCAQLLREDIKAPIEVEGSFILGDHVVHGLGASHLDGIWDVLKAGGFCIQITGDGTVCIRPKPTEPLLEVSTTTRSLLMSEFSRSYPIEDIPNVIRVFDGEQKGEARNDDPKSPTSTVARGREIEEVEDSPARKEGETLTNYAVRRLAELSDVYETVDIEREWIEGIYPYSVVCGNLPEAGIDGTFRVMSQTVSCKLGVKVGETWGRMS